MAILYYGGGDCTVEGNVSSIGIDYKGYIVIDSKLPDGYTIELYEGSLVINPPMVASETFPESVPERANLNKLFKYLGEFKIIHAVANNLEGDSEPISIKRVMDYSELLNTNAEDLTTKSENLKVKYVQGRKFKRTHVLSDGSDWGDR